VVKIVGLAHSQGLDFEPEDKSSNLAGMSQATSMHDLFVHFNDPNSASILRSIQVTVSCKLFKVAAMTRTKFCSTSLLVANQDAPDRHHLGGYETRRPLTPTLP
jgi:hypothetical protein